jgi:hypothetical protein
MQELDPKVVAYLNSKKVFCIPSQNKRWMSYFIVRSWGNYLFFPHPDISNMYPFIKTQGGIYKVFDETIPFPFYNTQIFTLFGASTVGAAPSFHKDFQIEIFGEDYFDIDLAIEQAVFKLFHLKEELRFVDYNRSLIKDGPLEFSRMAFIN